jgi:drug/metabolite transporter (DMT)-like permease
MSPQSGMREESAMNSCTRASAAPSNQRAASTAALLAAVLFGCGAPAAKALLGAVDPPLLAGLLYLGSGLALAIARALRGPRALGFKRRDGVWLAAAVAAGGVIAPLLLLVGLSRTSASSASLVLVLEAPFTALMARLLFGEHVGRRTWQGLALTTLGAAATVAAPESTTDTLGIGCVALACLGWGLDNNFTREVSHLDPLTVAAAKGLVGGSVNLAAALMLGAQLPDVGVIVPAAVVGVVSYGASLVLYLLALRSLGASRVAALFAVAPFAGAVAGVAALGEPATPGLAVAALLGGLGVWRLVGESHVHWHFHEPVEHSHVHHHDAHHNHDHDTAVDAEPHRHWHRHDTVWHDHLHAPDALNRHRHD